MTIPWWVIALAAVALAAVYVFLRQRATGQSYWPEPVELDATPDRPVHPGYKIQWLAVRSGEPEAVVEALGLGPTQRANWETGIGAARDDGVFVSPPVDGWVLVVSFFLPNLGDDRDPGAWGRLMNPLAARFPEVHYYGSSRVISYYGWACFKGNELIRAYASMEGKVVADFGHFTDDEIALGLDFAHDEAKEAATAEDWLSGEVSYPSEESVVRLASKWSVDPLELDQWPEVGVGWYSEQLPYEGSDAED